MKRIRLASLAFAIVALAAGVLAASASAIPIYNYGFSFGSGGSGDGQFSAPRGVAVDSKGNVWVADFGNDRIQEFNSKGEFIGKFGTSGTGKLDGPNDLAIDTSDNVWVTDMFNHRIVKFNSKGEYQTYILNYGNVYDPFWYPKGVAIDSEGNLWSTSGANYPLQKYNSKGELLGKYKEGVAQDAYGIATDSEGHVWVSDPEFDRTDELTSKGELLLQLEKDPLGNYIFDSPLGIAVDTANRAWVVDANTNRVLTYNSKGELQRSFGKKGSGEGQFSSPNGIAVDPVDNFWVVDSGNNRVERWGALPEVTTSAADASKLLLKGLVNPRGTETTYRFEYGTTTSYGTSVPVPDKLVGSGTGNVEVSQVAEGLKDNTTYHFRVVATNAFGTSFGEDKAFVTPEKWGLQATAEPSGATGSSLSSVSCTASETCAAVGFYWPASGAKTLAKVESAGSWSLTTTPNPSGATFSALYDVSCTTSSACTAVGDATSEGTATLAERWNGSSWTIQSTPNPAGAKWSNLLGVACTASNDCTAVGYAGETEISAHSTLAEHWNGTSWSIMTTPNVEGATKSELRSISCVSAGDCWAVGDSVGKSEVALAEHWNGTAWSINSPASLSGKLSDISCASASSCVATTNGLTVARWNGSTWSTETAPAPAGAKTGSSLSDISCTSASACVATGRYPDANWVWRPLAEGWDGSKWSVQSTSAPPNVEEAKNEEEGEAGLSGGVSCTSATACTAVGSYRLPTFAQWSLVEVRH